MTKVAHGPVSGRRPTVAILATGGTIQNTLSGRIPVRQLIDEVLAQDREVKFDVPEFVEHDAIRVGSEDFEPRDWVRIARAAQELADRPEVTGIVVTHGTFTVEETAFFLHLTVNTEKPIVFTCSQRKHRVVGNDGDRNLIDAIRAACALGPGVGSVLVMGEEIHSAREVYKSNQRPGGFASGSLGLLGSAELRPHQPLPAAGPSAHRKVRVLSRGPAGCAATGGYPNDLRGSHGWAHRACAR